MMMQLLFALFVVAVLAIGLYHRKKQKKEWVKEERHEESGAWIDKRAGERGTWGSLDEETELARQNVSRQGRVTELALLVRTFCFEQYPGFHLLSDEQIKKFSAFARELSAQIIPAMEQIKNGREPDPAAELSPEETLPAALKKQVLHFAYQNYPGLLELDIERIRQFDALTGKWAATFLGKISDIK